MLEQALLRLRDEDEASDGDADDKDPSLEDVGARDRDTEDTRSRNQPVRPSPGRHASEEQPRGGTR